MAVNGYFQLVNTQKGFGVKCVPPKEGGENVPLSELIDYLGARSIAYDISALSKAVNAGTVQVVPPGDGRMPSGTGELFTGGQRGLHDRDSAVLSPLRDGAAYVYGGVYGGFAV